MILAWFSNQYLCDSCDHTWESEWSCMCDDDCPFCGARHISPSESDDMTAILRKERGDFVVLRSPDDAEHKPLYEEVDRFGNLQAAEAYLAGMQGSRVRS